MLPSSSVGLQREERLLGTFNAAPASKFLRRHYRPTEPLPYEIKVGQLGVSMVGGKI